MNKNIHTKPPSKLLCPQYGGPVRSFLGNHLHRSELRIEQKRPRERKRLIFLDEPEAFGEASEIIHHDSFVLHAEFIRPLADRSEEHTSELQSPDQLVCRLLLEKKKK